MYSQDPATLRAVRRRRLARAGWAGLAVALVLAALVALNWSATGWPAGPAGAAVDLLPSSAGQIANARAQLERLPRRGQAAEYRRSSFGEAWADTDGNGCNQRDDVLLRDLVASRPFQVQRQRLCDHDVLAGTWVDPYTGATITLTDAKQPDQAKAVQIDHIVALSIAWRSGAHRWSDKQRLSFANDLANLLAVGGPANQAKGASDPTRWQPVRAARCGYAVRYIAMKSAYSLASAPAERAALAGMLATCPA